MMAQAVPTRITPLLRDWRAGNEDAAASLWPQVFGELQHRARCCLVHERRDHTLRPTALVNEAYLRLAEQRVEWRNRTHFFAVASSMMRRILVDHARRRHAAKRGDSCIFVPLHDAIEKVGLEPRIELLVLDRALSALAEFAPRQSQIVELRFFGGLTLAETAEALGVSPATVKLDWSLARAWLYRELSAE